MTSGNSCEFGGEFIALGLAAREGGGALSEFNVSEADLFEHFEFSGERWYAVEDLYSFGDGQIEDVGDIEFFVLDAQGFGVEPFSVACGTFDIYVGEELHFDFLDAVALALFAAPAFYVEAESTRFISPHFGFRQGGE